MIRYDTLRDAATYAVHSDALALVFDHPGERPYGVAVDDEARKLLSDGHVPYTSIDLVEAAAMPRVPDYPPPA